jgi:hypothetical protein
MAMKDAKQLRLFELPAQDGIKIAYLAHQAMPCGSVITLLGSTRWARACSQVWEIAQGILRQQGAMAIDKDFFSEQQNFPLLIKELIAGVRDVVKKTIGEEQMGKYIADASSFLCLLNDYRESPRNGLGILRMIVEADAYPVGPLEALEWNFPIAVQAYLAGALLRLAVLQEDALQSNEQKHYEGFRAFAVAAATTGRAATTALVEMNDARVSAVTFQRDAGGCHRVGNKRECWWWHKFSYSVDNIVRERARLSTDEKNADEHLQLLLEEERASDLTRIREQFEESILHPISHTIDLLDMVANMSFSSTPLES